jgi:hypothetical protein
MIRLMGKLCNEQGEVFNNQVADILEQIPGVKVQRRVKKIGQLTIATPRGKLGDIDVLVIDQGRLLLEVIECKDLALARTPYELQFELKNLFQGNNPIIVRHQRRVDWVRNHLADILKWAGVDDNNNWRVESLIVVDEELFTPYLQQSPVQIVAFQQLKEWVQHQIETASSPTIL